MNEERLSDAELRQLVLTDPEVEALQLDLLSDGETPPDLTLAAALAEAAIETPPVGAWEVEAVHPSQPGSYFLVPPEPGSLSVAEGWDLAYALQRQPGVIDAEPLFELTLDVADQPAPDDEDDEEETGSAEAGFEAASAALSAEPGDCDPVPVDEADHDWSPDLIRATAAWNIPSGPHGAARGRGVRIGHPDSGYVDHPELFDPSHEPQSRVLAHLGFDFVGKDPDPKHPDGSHGLSTATVAMSADHELAAGFVHGVAPEAELVPFRVAKKGLVPVPVLLRGGMRRLAKAIYRAVDTPASCHVISISLGSLKNKAVRRAVGYAFDHDVIVVAATGNRVRFVVWPAAYPEVIAMAGCTARRRKWKGSSRGKQVDATAPAHRVWKARKGGGVETSNGTSYAAASTAGIAALWLGHWGRDHLLEKYEGEFKLATVFRRILRASSDPPPPGHDGRFGAGIVNACRVLQTPLPTLEELRASDAQVLESWAFSVAPSVASSGLESVAEALGRPATDLRAPLARVLATDPEQLTEALQGIGDEVAFHILTTPALRDVLAGEPEPAAAAFSLEAGPPTTALPAERLSHRLRNRIGR